MRIGTREAQRREAAREADAMSEAPLFRKAFPYQKDLFALPVGDLEAAVDWYGRAFGLKEVERRTSPHPTVILERDGVRIGFAINGGDASQDGAAILVSDIHRAKAELEANGIQIGNWRVDARNGQMLQVFFVAAPDGLCYYFHQPIQTEA
jgi:catechol 2,3-dioxygenase-like lactoylglutathione lyase family enzyme